MRRALTLLLAAWLPTALRAADIAASEPRDLSVTIYRAPDRGSGRIDLDNLKGFALVTETREVQLPSGTSRLRFEGVADGIEAASAIVTGLPEGVIEKDRDAHLLSPSALVAAAVGKPVTLVRTHPKTGQVTRVTGTIVSGADGGVVFRSVEGIEALRCSGLPETFDFDPVTTGLSARPTLSVLTRSDRPMTATVTLSYLAHGFDWAADYVATLSPNGRAIDLGAWVTLANGNGGSFPDARTQVVAGRLNRASGAVEPIDEGGPILAECWPLQTTKATPSGQSIEMPPAIFAPPLMMMRAPAPMADIIVTAARRVSQEQLGDLKLYRVPERTTIAGRQSKQVRLLDRAAIPVIRIYGADLPADETLDLAPARVLLRTTNDVAHHLGLPLPSGRVATFQSGDARPLLVGEGGIADTAIGETVEFTLGASPDVQVRQVHEEHDIDAAHAKLLPLVPGVLAVRSIDSGDRTRVEISNAGAAPVAFELRLRLDEGRRIVQADHAVAMKNGRPIFRLTIPAHRTIIVRYLSEVVKDAG